MKTEDSKELSEEKVKKIKDEIADIFIFMTYLCNHFSIDLLDAVTSKIQENDRKYPVDKAKGSSKKYTEIK
jgi:dCTP diphosphatase